MKARKSTRKSTNKLPAATAPKGTVANKPALNSGSTVSFPATKTTPNRVG